MMPALHLQAVAHPAASVTYADQAVADKPTIRVHRPLRPPRSITGNASAHSTVRIASVLASALASTAEVFHE